jgi:hypothetical protein
VALCPRRDIQKRSVRTALCVEAYLAASARCSDKRGAGPRSHAHLGTCFGGGSGDNATLLTFVSRRPGPASGS